MRNAATLFAAAAILASPMVAQASEADFLSQFEGSWSGGGAVKVRAGSPAVNVTCQLNSDANGEALSMNGSCRALIIATRQIGADIQASGGSYSGSYIGAGSGTAGLSGSRSGDTINLAINWAKEVNGDRKAQMELASVGEGRMRLRTIDTDPKTGETVVTSDIELSRN